MALLSPAGYADEAEQVAGRMADGILKLGFLQLAVGGVAWPNRSKGGSPEGEQSRGPV
jgi:hypothetical protein